MSTEVWAPPAWTHADLDLFASYLADEIVDASADAAFPRADDTLHHDHEAEWDKVRGEAILILTDKLRPILMHGPDIAVTLEVAT